MHHILDLIIHHIPSVLMITESWCDANTLDYDIALPGYTLFRKDRASGRGGGCLIYTSNHLKADYYNHPILDTFVESVWITINYRALHVFIGCVYRAPNSTKHDTLNLISAFNLVSDLPFSQKLIAGDFNMPDINWTTYSALNNTAFISAINVSGWKQLVKTPTRSHNILDLIFTLNVHSASAVVLDAFSGSDHKIVKCLFKLPQSSHPNPIRNKGMDLPNIHSHFNLPPIHAAMAFRPHLDTIDWLTFQTILRSLDFSIFFNTPCPVLSTRLFIGIVTTCLDIIAPSSHQPTKIKYGSSKKTIKFNKKISRLKSQYNRSHDFSSALQLATLHRKASDEAQRKLLDEETTALNSRQKSLAISQLLRRRKPRVNQSISFITTANNSVINDPKLISEVFSTYFASTFISDNYPLPLFTGNDSSATLERVPTTVDMIRSTLQSIKPSLMPGSDGIPPVALKFGGDDIPLILCKIFNVSLESGVFPPQWKTSIIIPRHKSGPKDDVQNYRPINHTPISSRIFEKIIKKCLLDFLGSKDILNTAQHGFISKRSCATCHLDFFDFITSSVDKGLSIIVVYLDMNKAFDRVPHHRLLMKLRSIGMGGNLIRWFSSFLSKRMLVVKIGNDYSSPRDITSGVIQGSVLGPILFLVYINDIFDIFSFGKPFMFADDIKIVYAFRPNDLQNTIIQIQKELNSLDNWSTLWQIKFSPDKSGITAYKCTPPADALTLKGKVISIQNTVRDLGLRYSGNYNFSHQVSHQLAKCRQLLGIIYRVIKLPQVKLELYKTQVRPLLEYSSLVGGNLRKCDRIAVESLQRTFTKYVVGSSSAKTYRERCIALSLDPLWLRRMKLNLFFLHSLLYGGIPNNNPLLKLQNNGPHHLRNKANTLIIPMARSSLRDRFFSNRYAIIWNRLPPDVRAISNRFQFKMRLKAFCTPDNILHLFQINLTLDYLYENGPDYI